VANKIIKLGSTLRKRKFALIQMKKYFISHRTVSFILLLNFFSFITLAGNFNSDSLPVNKKTGCNKSLFLFMAGYRMPLNKNNIINSGHGVYLEGGINPGRLISKNLVMGIYAGFAMQDRFWSTSFTDNFSNDYTASINKDQSLTGIDSAVIYSSTDLFKNTKGTDATLPGCQMRSFHNYSMYYGMVFRLPVKCLPFLKIYSGTTRSHHQGDGNLATKNKSYNIFELRRKMYGCELGILSPDIRSLKCGHTSQISKTIRSIGLSIYYESCNFYNSSLYFDDGTTRKNILLQSFTTPSFLKKYKNDVTWGIKLCYYIM